VQARRRRDGRRRQGAGQQALERPGADRLLVDAHGGQRRDQVARDRDVVEPDDRHVVRHGEPRLVQGPDDPDGAQVVRAEDRGEAPAGGEQALAGSVPAGRGQVAALVEAVVGLEPGLLEGAQVAQGPLLDAPDRVGAVAQRRHGFHVRAADERHVTVAPSDQVAHRGPAAAEAVAQHCVGGHAVRHVVDEHERDVGPVQGQHDGLRGGADQQDAVQGR
jgi:hypothetical protein